jgi:hypothetical protein
MERLNERIEIYLENIKKQLDALPKANKRDGFLSDLRNQAANKVIMLEAAGDIVNSEYDKMIDYVNGHLIQDYTDEQIELFESNVKERTTEFIQSLVHFN